YFLTLVGLCHLDRLQTNESLALFRKVREFQRDSGVVTGAESSITGSQGRDLDVESTALAIFGWLKSDRPGEFQPNIDKAVRWLHQQRQGAGSYGNAPATVLALQAMMAYHQKNPLSLQAGEVRLTVLAPPQGVGGALDAYESFTSRSQDTIKI